MSDQISVIFGDSREPSDRVSPLSGSHGVAMNKGLNPSLPPEFSGATISQLSDLCAAYIRFVPRAGGVIPAMMPIGERHRPSETLT